MIGKKGEDIESLQGRAAQDAWACRSHVNIEEIRKPEIDAQLIADSITQQLEKRIMFRRAMKRAMQNAMRLGAQGIKIMCVGPPERHRDRAHRVVPRRPRAAAHAARRHRLRLLAKPRPPTASSASRCWVYKGDTLGRSEAPVVDDAGRRRAPRGPRAATVAPGGDRRGRAAMARKRGGPAGARPRARQARRAAKRVRRRRR